MSKNNSYRETKTNFTRSVASTRTGLFALVLGLDDLSASVMNVTVKKNASRACSSIQILSSNCQILLSRDWRGDIPCTELAQLIDALKRSLETGSSSPIIYVEQSDFALFFVAHNDVYIACAASRTTDVAGIFVFLHKLIAIFSMYFNSFVEESVRDNFVLIYELLDEVVDNGYPQITDPGVLHEFIKVHANCFEAISPPLAVTNSISWRTGGIFYKKNEIFLDAIEHCSLAVDAAGNETRSFIIGTICVRSQLSGLPICELSLNDRTMPTKVEVVCGSLNQSSGLEDVKFHPCVDLGTYTSKRLVCFTPPDGKFDLMTYRTSVCGKPLIDVHATSTIITKTTVSYTVNLSTLFKEHTSATSIQIEIPVHTDVTSPEIRCSYGTVVYVPEKDILLWTLRNVKGSRRFKLQSKLSLPSTRDLKNSTPSNIPVRVNFEIPYYTASGLQVKYLKVLEKEGYRALPWVRYITRTNDYEFRLRKQNLS